MGYPQPRHDVGARAYASPHLSSHGYNYQDTTYPRAGHAMYAPPPPHLQPPPGAPPSSSRAEGTSAAAPSSSAAGTSGPVPLEEQFESTLRLESNVHTRGYSAGAGDPTVEHATGAYSRDFRPSAADLAPSPRDMPRAGIRASPREVRAPVRTLQARAEQDLGAAPEFQERLPRGRRLSAEGMVHPASAASPSSGAAGTPGTSGTRALAGGQGTPGTTPRRGSGASEQRDFSSAYSEDALFNAFLQFATFGQSKLQVRAPAPSREAGAGLGCAN